MKYGTNTYATFKKRWQQLAELAMADDSPKGVASRDMIVGILDKLYENASELTLEVLKKAFTVWLQMYDNVVVHKIDAIDGLVSDYRKSISVYIVFNELDIHNVAILNFTYDLPVNVLDFLKCHPTDATIIDVAKFITASTCVWDKLYDYDKPPTTAQVIRKNEIETIWADGSTLYRQSAFWGKNIDTNRHWFIDHKMIQASEFAEANSYELFMAKYEFEDEIFNIPNA